MQSSNGEASKSFRIVKEDDETAARLLSSQNSRIAETSKVFL